MKTDLHNIIECYSCGLFVKKFNAKRGKTRCPRCNSKLLVEKPHSVDSFYFAISALLLFITLNLYPFISLSINSVKLESNLINSVFILLQQDLFFVALIVLFTIIIAPIASCLIIILSFIQKFLKIKIFTDTFIHDSFYFFKKWGFIDVFIISIIIAYIKLVGMVSNTVFDVGFYVMILYIFCFYMAINRYESKDIFGE